MFARVFFLLLTVTSPPPGSSDQEALHDLRALPEAALSVGPSLAVGGHGGGSLRASLRYDQNHPELRVIKRSRRNRYDYGHSRLVHALEDIARRYSHSVWPPRPLWLGNTGNPSGGKIAPSRSHQTGLDVDIVFPTLGERRPEIERVHVTPKAAAVHARNHGKASLDVPASWSLVQEILETHEIDVLWLFVSRPIRDALIEHAVQIGAPEEIVARAIFLLHQPSDSLPHDDHLHLRIACSASDRFFGCRDVGARWPWLGTTDHWVRAVLFDRISGAWVRDDRERVSMLRRLRQVQVQGIQEQIVPFLFWPDTLVQIEAARTLRHVAPKLLVAWSLGHPDPEPFRAEINSASLRAPGPVASALMVERLARLNGCAPRNDVDDVDVALRVLRRHPVIDALPYLKDCVLTGRRKTAHLAKESLARLAGRAVPKGSRSKVVTILNRAIERGPEDRLIRMERHYLPLRGSRRARALRRLKARVLASGVDGMNVRELLERLYDFSRQTNDISGSRRRRIWRNRSGLMKYVPVPLDQRDKGVE